MRTITGPGLFLAQFARDTPPHNTLPGIARWAKAYGYKAIQIPTWDKRFFDLDRAYESEAYCDEIKGALADIGVGARQPGETAPLGGRSGAQGGPCFAPLRTDRACELYRVARLALFLSLSAAAGRIDRGMFRRAGPPLEADPRRLRGAWRRSLLRNSPERGRLRRRYVRHVSRRGRRPQALQHQLRREPLHQAMH